MAQEVKCATWSVLDIEHVVYISSRKADEINKAAEKMNAEGPGKV
jgi:hypothetical protein